MVVILEQFAHHKEIEHKRIAAFVVIVEVLVTVFMSAPVDNSTMDWTHQKMNGQQEIHQPMRACQVKKGNAAHIHGNIKNAPSNPHRHIVCETIEFCPIGNVFRKPFFWAKLKAKVVVIDIFCFPHHGKQVFSMVWAVWILRGIRVRVMHAV